MPVGDLSGAAPRTALMRDSQFLRYWAARVISYAGTTVTFVVLPIFVYQITGSSLWTAVIGASQGLPYLIIGVLAGAIADRHNRRRLMIIASLANAALAGTVPLAAALAPPSPSHLLTVALGLEITVVLMAAADFGALPTLVGRERNASAQAAVFGSTALASLTVPAATSAALAIIEPRQLPIFNTLAAAGAAVLFWSVSRPMTTVEPTPAASGIARDVWAGLRFLWRQAVLRTQALLGTAQSFAAGALTGQLVPWADHVLGVPPTNWRLGILLATWAFGGLLASTISSAAIRRLGEPRVTLLGIPLALIGALAGITVTSWLPALLAVTVWALGYELAELASIVLRQRMSPDALLGRINATARVISIGVGYPAGALVGGAIAAAFGPRVAIAAAALVIAAAASAGWASPLRTASVPR